MGTKQMRGWPLLEGGVVSQSGVGSQAQCQFGEGWGLEVKEIRQGRKEVAIKAPGTQVGPGTLPGRSS